MKMFEVPRLALLGSAAALVLAACSSDKPASDLAGPNLTPRAVIALPSAPGVPTAGYVQVCVDNTSPTQVYNVTVTGGNPATDLVTTPVVLSAGGCATALRRTFESGSPSPVSTATLTLQNSGTASYVCAFYSTGNPAVDAPFCGTGSGAPVSSGSGAVAVASANQFHGSTVTFHLEQPIVVVPPPPPPPAPPPPPPPPIGCTYTQGWWKNKGAAITAQYDFDGGVNNGLTILNTTPRGNPYYILAHQYIAATLNVASGASMTGAVLTAYNSATAYFVAASAASPLPAPYTKAGVTALSTALDNYNNGVTGPGHCN